MKYRLSKCLRNLVILNSILVHNTKGYNDERIIRVY